MARPLCSCSYLAKIFPASSPFAVGWVTSRNSSTVLLIFSLSEKCMNDNSIKNAALFLIQSLTGNNRVKDRISI